MKKTVVILMVCALLTGALFLSSCGGEREESASQPAAESSEHYLGRYFASYVKGDNPLYGTWQLEDVDYISYIFRNDNLAEMVMGNEGAFTQLEVDSSEKTLSLQFPIGLNGSYSYRLSDDDKTLTLTLTTDKAQKFTLKKQDNYNLAPKAPDNPAVDEALVGWWNGEGFTYYFGGDGIMYCNSISLETCYSYSAEDGKITAVYDYGGEMKQEFDYKLSGDSLTVNGKKLKKLEKNK